MFHVQLRQFPHVTREFNLERGALDARVLRPWVRGEVIELGDRKWAPERAKLEVYEGRELATPEIGMGRGWANVTRAGEDVTDRVLAEARGAVQAPPALDELKAALLQHAHQGSLSMARVLEIAGELPVEMSATERVDLAVRAVWDLLQDGGLELSRPAPG